MPHITYEYEEIRVNEKEAKEIISELQRKEVTKELRQFMLECAATSSSIQRKGPFKLGY
jgi:hypothetical protein